MTEAEIATRELLQAYSEFLEKEGYMDGSSRRNRRKKERENPEKTISVDEYLKNMTPQQMMDSARRMMMDDITGNGMFHKARRGEL